jgi:Repeat of unknown function (DUF1136).
MVTVLVVDKYGECREILLQVFFLFAARRSIYLESQHPEGLAKIRELEAQGRPARLEVEEPVVTPPRFITELRVRK